MPLTHVCASTPSPTACQLSLKSLQLSCIICPPYKCFWMSILWHMQTRNVKITQSIASRNSQSDADRSQENKHKQTLHTGEKRPWEPLRLRGREGNSLPAPSQVFRWLLVLSGQQTREIPKWVSSHPAAPGVEFYYLCPHRARDWGTDGDAQLWLKLG